MTTHPDLDHLSDKQLETELAARNLRHNIEHAGDELAAAVHHLLEHPVCQAAIDAGDAWGSEPLGGIGNSNGLRGHDILKLAAAARRYTTLTATARTGN